MLRRRARLLLVAATLALAACATDLGTGFEVAETIEQSYPITVGRLVDAHMDTRHRLRIYLQICQDATQDGMICSDDDLRVMALVEAEKRSLLERIAERYLVDGRDKPVYVYGPLCDGFEEMIVVPRCQSAVAIGIWDPRLRDYVLYSTHHGSGALVNSSGFSTFLEVTGRAAGLARKAVR